MSRFEPAEFYIPVSIPQMPRTYGPVNRNGRVFYRNYGRELKTDNAKSITDILQLCIKVAQDRIARQCGINEFMIGITK